MPRLRKDIAMSKAKLLRVSLAKISKNIGYNNRESLYQQLKKDDIDIELFNRIMEYLDSLDKKVSLDNSVKQKISGEGANYNLNNSTLTNSEEDIEKRKRLLEEVKSLKKDIERLEAIIRSKDETIAALKLSIK